MIDIEQAKKIAALARLSLSEEQLAAFAPQLNDIFGYMEKLNELDTADVEPTSNIMELENVSRPDEHRESLPVEELMANAPDPADREGEKFYRVPRIIEG